MALSARRKICIQAFGIDLAFGQASLDDRLHALHGVLAQEKTQPRQKPPRVKEQIVHLTKLADLASKYQGAMPSDGSMKLQP
jgi:hypothetical protein